MRHPATSLPLAAAFVLAAAGAAPAQTVVTLTPSQDTFIVDSQPGTNFGTSTDLRFGRGVFWGLGNTRTLVQFDLGSLPTDERLIRSALFSAYQYNTEPAAGGLTCELWDLINAWFETSVTWNSQPGLSPFSWSAAYVGDSNTTGWIYWEAGTLVRNTRNGTLPDYGWMFKMTHESAGASRLGYFHSREYAADPAKRPRLEVELYDLLLDVPQLFAGQTGSFTVSDGNPGETVYVAVSTTGLGTTPVGALGVELELDDPQLVGSATVGAGGTATFSRTVPPGALGRTAHFQAVAQGQRSNVVTQIVQ